MGSEEEFKALDEKTMAEYVKATPALMAKLGNQSEGLKIRDIGDGNLNFVYSVIGDNGSLVIKQAPPYLRCVGESWPLTKERAYFEALALKAHGRLCPDHVPEVYHIDRPMSLTAMRYIEPPHIVLRHGLFAGIEYPFLTEHMSEYLAKTLFFTSPLFCSTLEHKRSVAEFRGNELHRHTEKITFTDPYIASAHNRWTSPYLDNDAEAVRQDDNLKLEAAEMKSKFCERAQVLIHGDLHTGSVMVTQDSTHVIDLEFAFYGPVGFDIGTFLGNLMLAFFAQDGHANQENDRKKYKQWILRVIEEIWNLFEKKFVSLWNVHKDVNGEADLSAARNTPKPEIPAQKEYMKDLFHDSLGFAAVNMIRGILSVAHVDDLEWITDAGKRASCERHALNLAKLLLKERRRFESIGQVILAIRDISSV